MPECKIVDNWPVEGYPILLALAITLGASERDEKRAAEIIHAYAHYFQDITTDQGMSPMMARLKEAIPNIGLESALGLVYEHAKRKFHDRSPFPDVRTMDAKDMPPEFRDIIAEIKKSLGVPDSTAAVVGVTVSSKEEEE